MSMSKQDFIALADAITDHNGHAALSHNAGRLQAFTPDQLEALASFCRGQNSQFKKDRWTSYIAGECGKNGGTIKRTPAELLLDKVEHTPSFEKLGRELAMNFGTPAKSLVQAFCAEWKITEKQYDAMMQVRAARKAAR